MNLQLSNACSLEHVPIEQDSQQRVEIFGLGHIRQLIKGAGDRLFYVPWVTAGNKSWYVGNVRPLLCVLCASFLYLICQKICGYNSRPEHFLVLKSEKGGYVILSTFSHFAQPKAKVLEYSDIKM